MSSIFCFRKCCNLKVVKPSEHTCTTLDEEINKTHFGAGVCVISPDGVLVSQAHHLFWGFPKGIIENNESLVECALRELEEETGLVVLSCELQKFVFSFRYKDINRKVTIFFLISKKSILLNKSEHIFSDSTGYGFVQPICFLELYYSGKIKINYFTRILLKLLFGL
jgi:8-oxo-dGTP pyrophosphatase MutT (NUDIX family)